MSDDDKPDGHKAIEDILDQLNRDERGKGWVRIHMLWLAVICGVLFGFIAGKIA